MTLPLSHTRFPFFTEIFVTVNAGFDIRHLIAVDTAIDAPGGFLFEWWSVFWDIFIARTNEKHSEAAAAYIETQQMKAREHQQQLQMQQLQLMQQRNAQLQLRDQNPSLGGPINKRTLEG
ncbi:hypothetical protein HAX54_016142 [Datura stramonium]|uniref:Uncharacterized protein n=1 Tax=Datura stramonium TaxID=4076 RepID=A0ABS8RZN5_DATST|nr:hypothetical protein [Datura stramonium]